VLTSQPYHATHPPPQTPQELANHNCLRFSLPGFTSTWRFRKEPDQAFDVAVTGDMAMTNALALRRAALDGAGIALLADWTVADDLSAGTLIDLFADWEVTATSFETAAWIVYPSRSYVPAKTRAFIDHVRAQT